MPGEDKGGRYCCEVDLPAQLKMTGGRWREALCAVCHLRGFIVARIYALSGDANHAIPILKRLLDMPYLAPLTPAKLRTDPTLEQIRNDPRFQELLAEKTP